MGGAGGDGDAKPGEADDVTTRLVAIGFRPKGVSRRGGRMWVLPWSRILTFVLHEYQDACVLTWSLAFGEHLVERGWRSSITDPSVAEVYPEHDVRLPLEVEAVEAEIRRVLASLRLDLGDPSL